MKLTIVVVEIDLEEPMEDFFDVEFEPDFIINARGEAVEVRDVLYGSHEGQWPISLGGLCGCEQSQVD